MNKFLEILINFESEYSNKEKWNFSSEKRKIYRQLINTLEINPLVLFFDKQNKNITIKEVTYEDILLFNQNQVYLFPIVKCCSCMTKDEESEYKCTFWYEDRYDFVNKIGGKPTFETNEWLYTKNFDAFGLLNEKLAIESNYYNSVEKNIDSLMDECFKHFNY